LHETDDAGPHCEENAFNGQLGVSSISFREIVQREVKRGGDECAMRVRENRFE